MCSTAQMRSRTIAGGARDSLSRQQSGAAVFATSPCSASRNATWIMVARRYHPQVTVTTAHEIEITRYVRRRRGPVLRKEITSNPQAKHNAHGHVPKRKSMRNAIAIGGCTCQHQRPDRPVRTPRGAAVPHGPSGAAAETGKRTI